MEKKAKGSDLLNDIFYLDFMKNFKEKFKKFENWNGWKWCYSFSVFCILFLSVIILWDTIYVIINDGYPPFGLPIGAECCGWSYKTVKNHTIYGIGSAVTYLVSLGFVARRFVKYSHKFITTLVLMELFFLIQNFINPLP